MRGAGGRILDYVRAGCLAAGIASLVGVWFQGMHQLGFRGSFPDGLGDFLLMTGIGVIVGAWLGFPERASSVLAVLGRAVGTAITGIVLGALVGGLSGVMVKKLDIAERKLPPYFVAAGVLLLALGLRRFPRSTAARVALGSVVALLLTMRLLALSPETAHKLTRRIFPLREAKVRADLEQGGCGPYCWDGRSKIVDLKVQTQYGIEFVHLAAEVQIEATLEVTKSFFVDGCGDVHGAMPTVPPWVREFPTQAACEAKHPAPHYFQYTVREPYRPSPCCLFEVKERRPGERLRVVSTRRYAFHHLAWVSE